MVTDHDTAAELTLKQLGSEGTTRILVIHDSEATSPGALLDLVEEFLVSVGRASAR